jgi:hypothetical protein
MGDRLFGNGDTLPTVHDVPTGFMFFHTPADKYLTKPNLSIDAKPNAVAPQSETVRPTDVVPQTAPRAADTVQRTGHQPELENGTLKIKLGDSNIGNAVAQSNFSTLQLDTPPGVEVREWIDKGGFYFWFRDTNSGKSADGEKYYVGQNVKGFCINNENYNAEALRLKTAENVANLDREVMLKHDQDAGVFNITAKLAASKPAFENIERKDATNPNWVVKYADRMAALSGGTTAAEQKVLEDSVANSQNPYMRIYLSDIYYAQAMKPIFDQYKAYGRYDVSQGTLQRIDRAIDTLKTVTDDSQQALRQINKAPAADHMTPLDPYEIFLNPQSGYYGFWAGSYDQANQRMSALRLTRTLITTGSIGSIMHNSELLPPTVRPR